MSILKKINHLATAAVKASTEAAKTVANEAKLYSRLAECKKLEKEQLLFLGSKLFEAANGGEFANALTFEGVEPAIVQVRMLRSEIEVLEEHLDAKDGVSSDDALKEKMEETEQSDTSDENAEAEESEL